MPTDPKPDLVSLKFDPSFTKRDLADVLRKAAPTRDTTPIGVELIHEHMRTPLTRLHFFDGKFLRASHFKAEQDYFRYLVALSNRPEAPGVVYGMEVVLDGSTLRINPGLAIDPDGYVLLLPAEGKAEVPELLERSRRRAPRTPEIEHGTENFAACETETEPEGGTDGAGVTFYRLTVCRTEALCGTEDVYGRLCEEACVTSTARPFRVEGMVLRARRIALDLDTSGAVVLGSRHWRSLAASAYFEAERLHYRGSRRISGTGLRSRLWCSGAEHESGCEVPLGLLACTGDAAEFVDGWTARRERMETTPRRYWAWKMEMRPWNVFLAQVLQFQCQLHGVLGREPEEDDDEDPCSGHREVLRQASSYLGIVERGFERPEILGSLPGGLVRFHEIKERLAGSLGARSVASPSGMLVGRGIVELPPAGYLPVGARTRVNDQVRRMTGHGVSLRFCVAPADCVPHLFEEAQHMERISLIEGLDHPERKPQVEIIVPDGRITRPRPAADEFLYRATLAMSGMTTHGVARDRVGPGSARSFHFVGISEVEGALRLRAAVVQPAELFAAATGPRPPSGAAAARRFERLRVALDMAATNFRRAAFRRDVAPPATPDMAAMLANVPESLSTMWFTLSIAKDPVEMAAGETTTASGRLILGALHDSQLEGLEMSFDEATFTSAGVQELAGKRQVTGSTRLRLWTARIKTQGGISYENERSQIVNMAATLEYEGDTRAGSVTLTLSQGNQNGLELEVHRAFGIDGVGEARLRVSRGDDTFECRLGLTPDDRLRESGNETHRDAARAIAMTGQLVADPGFEARVSQEIFGPLLRGGGDVVIEAVHDWVLFRRRRIKECDAPAVMPPAEPTRRYRVWEWTVNTVEEADALYARLKAAPEDPDLELPDTSTFDLEVAFEGGTARLLSDPAHIASDWDEFEPGDRLVHALIARTDAEPALELERLRVVEDALPDTTAVEHASDPDYLTTIPAVLDDRTADGAILFITVKRAVECHRVIGLVCDEARVQVLWTHVCRVIEHQPTLPDVVRSFDAALRAREAEAHELGAVHFDVGSSAPVEADLTALAARIGNTAATPVRIGVWVDAQATDADDALKVRRSESLRDRLNAGLRTQIVLAEPPLTQGAVPPRDFPAIGGASVDSCSTITFLIFQRVIVG